MFHRLPKDASASISMLITFLIVIVLKHRTFIFGEDPFSRRLKLFFLSGFSLRIKGLQEKWKVISVTSLYHFHRVNKHLNISRRITAEISPLHIACGWTRNEDPWFPGASHKPLSYAMTTKLCIFAHVITVNM